VLAAALLWSTSGVFAKSPVFLDWPVSGTYFAVRGPLLAFWRALFACIILLPLMRRPRWTPRLIPAVIAFAAMNLTFLTALTATSAANAIWLQYTAPAWVFVLGTIIWREPFDRGDVLMLLCGVCGVALILLFEARGESLAGIAYGLASGIAYAGVVLTLRALRGEDTAWIVGLNHLATAALFAPYCLCLGIWPTAEQGAYLAAFGIVQMGLPYWLFARGLRTIASHEASLIVLIEPVLVPVWVYLVWRHVPSYESPRWWTILGGTLILLGLAARYWRAKPQPLADGAFAKS
jgi:drug/metabolite transporter (DMT)-like permease